MPSHSWKRREERAFLADPEAILGRGALAALTRIGARLGLDFAGIDFSILPDGRLLVFEANATMLVHPEDANGVLAYKNAAVAVIRAAFDRLVEERRARPSLAPPVLARGERARSSAGHGTFPCQRAR